MITKSYSANDNRLYMHDCVVGIIYHGNNLGKQIVFFYYASLILVQNTS